MTCHVEPDERLDASEVCVWLKIGQSDFRRQLDAGVWDGTFVVSGERKQFIARLVSARQIELANRVLNNNQQKGH